MQCSLGLPAVIAVLKARLLHRWSFWTGTALRLYAVQSQLTVLLYLVLVSRADHETCPRVSVGYFAQCSALSYRFDFQSTYHSGSFRTYLACLHGHECWRAFVRPSLTEYSPRLFSNGTSSILEARTHEQTIKLRMRPAETIAHFLFYVYPNVFIMAESEAKKR